MEIKDLYPLVLMIVLVGIILGIGILVMDKFGIEAKESTGANESLAMSGGTGTLSNDDLTSITSIVNSTDNRVIFTTPLHYNFTTAGVISAVGSNMSDDTVNVVYVYDRDTTATTSLTNSAAAISEISSSWLSLIITIAVLAIILGLVIRSFGKVER